MKMLVINNRFLYLCDIKKHSNESLALSHSKWFYDRVCIKGMFEVVFWIKIVFVWYCLAGCHLGGPVIPVDGWTGKMVSAEVIEPVALSSGTSVVNESGDIGDKAVDRLQVIICYGSLMSDHTALRLLREGYEPVFWDPAGSYRISDKEVKRAGDLIVRKQPTIETYWLWRNKACNNIGMEVFEWIISAQEAEKLHTILLNGCDSKQPEGEFITNTLGLFCAKAVSDFLKRFGPASGPHIEHCTMIPHKLAGQLWQQRPNFVYVFSDDQPLIQYTKID